MRFESAFSLAAVSVSAAAAAAAALTREARICTVPASGTNATDDAPAIQAAFAECNNGGRIVFNPTTYYVNSILNITGLEDVQVEIQGKLLVRIERHCLPRVATLH